MFNSVRIQNFRQFTDLRVDRLGPINLITGMNNSGKTSFIEAVFLLCAPTSPDTVLTIAGLRGVDRVATSESYAWGFIFGEGRTQSEIVLEGTRTGDIFDTLRIRASDESALTLSNGRESNGAHGQLSISTLNEAQPSLEYDYEIRSGSTQHRATSRIRLVDREPVVERASGFGQRRWHFVSHRPVDAEADATRFSRLVEARRKGEVIEALRVVEPRLTDLDVLALRPPVVAADIGLNRLVPMSYMGQGFERLLSIIPAIILTEGGTVLIDEIEDGLHHSVLTDVWRVIVSTALKYSVQVFATTHSWECIEAAVHASENHPNSLAFVRLERRSGRIHGVAGTDEELRAAVESGFELR